MTAIEVEIRTHHLHVPKHSYNDVWGAFKALNAEDQLKRGYNLANTTTDPNSVGNPHYNYSYMPWNYDTQYDGFIPFLEDYGFYMRESEFALEHLYYEGKKGQEDIFIQTLLQYASFRSEITITDTLGNQETLTPRLSSPHHTTLAEATWKIISAGNKNKTPTPLSIRTSLDGKATILWRHTQLVLDTETVTITTGERQLWVGTPDTLTEDTFNLITANENN